MVPARRLCGGLMILTAALVVKHAEGAMPGEEAARAVAARLEQVQVKEGPNKGLWGSESMFAGPATAGLACAYEWLGDAAYRQSAERGGDYILWIAVAQGHLLGDEVYAFVRLSHTSDDPNDNLWRTALVNFFASTRRPGETTEEYLLYFQDMDPSTATFYLAHHTIGAYDVNDQDKEIWRAGLIRSLSLVDDQSAFPVMALGVATWALAVTGPLDETPVASFGSAASWDGVTLSGLPALLLGHQVPQDEPYAGSFYWRFDHTAGSSDAVPSGYTEDAIYGALGLTAAARRAETVTADMEGAISAVHAALLDGVDDDGTVYEHLSHAGETYYVYAGEMLQGLWDLAQHLDARDSTEAD